MNPTLESVTAAANRLVDAFGRHDTEAYFAAFAPEATFVFHNLDRVLGSREDYRAEWRLWEERDGFRIVECRSSEQRIQFAGEIAIFTHRVETKLEFNGESSVTDERETIVFQRRPDDVWLAVHEHLSKCS
ncbi:nuclear transport factor 2 family protein [Rhizobiaceae bacterium n13]|uniref:Nuclear transport factor 2 family protein n=1 Tax=Ferirhizobium litorale TaxID=2927786 RepID=A0AAE3QF21_9HYPH|nr:nuclear transport factor 2 family protein [Fererhizobium litorale]MDI7862681.1 nuclear transport factor 2 family protein [Fererhizobium litorale]MDI7923836.1 nuclear transport factor 2 family protein [Fererhizobium litorale]